MTNCNCYRGPIRDIKVGIQLQLIEDSEIKAEKQAHFCSLQCLDSFLQESPYFNNDPWIDVKLDIRRPMKVLQVPKPGEPEEVKVIREFEPPSEPERERKVKVQIQVEGTFRSIEAIGLWLRQLKPLGRGYGCQKNMGAL